MTRDAIKDLRNIQDYPRPPGLSLVRELAELQDREQIVERLKGPATGGFTQGYVADVAVRRPDDEPGLAGPGAPKRIGARKRAASRQTQLSAPISRAERADPVLEAPGRPAARQLSHEEAEVETARVHQKALEDVGVAPQVQPAHAPGFIEMGVGALQALAPLPQQALAPGAPNAPSVAIHSSPRRRFAPPAPPAAIRLRHVAAKPEVSQRDQRLVAVIALVPDHLGDTPARGQDRFHLFGRSHQRLDHRRRVAGVGVLDGDTNDRTRLQVHRVLSLVGQVGAAVLHLRDRACRSDPYIGEFRHRLALVNGFKHRA